MKLWLDDLFDQTVSAVNPNDEDWIWAKNHAGFKNLIEEFQDKITLISYDNDLGEEIEGRHCFYIMEEMLSEGKLKNLKDIIIHSDNTGAVDSMMGAKDYLKRNYGIEMQRARRNTKKIDDKYRLKIK